jgi:uncharacterized glyoxalase superfamily protein PhnB
MAAKRLLSAVPVLKVANAARSITWYRRCFGFDADPFPDAEAPEFAILNRDGVEIMLQQVSGYVRPALARPGGIWDVHLGVPDARGLRAELAGEPGVTALRSTEYRCLEFLLSDPDGHVVVVSQELRADDDGCAR